MDTLDATVFYLNACVIDASMTFLSDIHFKNNLIVLGSQSKRVFTTVSKS